MRKIKTSAFCAILFLASTLAQSASAQVTFDSGPLEVEGLFGIGENTSYFVIDFGGTPDLANTPQDSYAFGFQFDDPSTTAAEGLLTIADQSELVFDNTDFGGSLGLGIDAFTFGDDTDRPDFSVDNRFWTTFVGTANEAGVDWEESAFGISSIALENGDFLGFRANVFESNPVTPPPTPNVPITTAIPEPSAIMLLGFVSLAGYVRRRR